MEDNKSTPSASKSSSSNVIKKQLKRKVVVKVKVQSENDVLELLMDTPPNANPVPQSQSPFSPSFFSPCQTPDTYAGLLASPLGELKILPKLEIYG